MGDDCGTCGRHGGDLLKCVKCKAVWYCGKRCQREGWKAHKGSCVTLEQRSDRLFKAVEVDMPPALERWDSDTVITLGMRCVDDLKLCSVAQDCHANLSIRLYEMLGRACSRKKRYTESAAHYEQASLACVLTGDFARQGLLLANQGDVLLSSDSFDAAKATFTRVERLGELGGFFDLYARACLGRARCASKSGEKAEAMVLAQESLKAAACMLSGEFGQERCEATALLVICDLSDMYADDFENDLLNRLLKLSVAIEDDAREGGTTLHIFALELVGRRHLAQGRSNTGADAYRQVLRLAADERFSGMEDIATLVRGVKQMLEHVEFFGLV
ncbi:hypothetical protein T484DRAFT_1757041 [Baffinella frigidus]|nr:hypothetical protein T484DRAFT_1757041 [Cryptophyta sp. CCMP2293]